MARKTITTLVVLKMTPIKKTMVFSITIRRAQLCGASVVLKKIENTIGR